MSTPLSGQQPQVIIIDYSKRTMKLETITYQVDKVTPQHPEIVKVKILTFNENSDKFQKNKQINRTQQIKQRPFR